MSLPPMPPPPRMPPPRRPNDDALGWSFAMAALWIPIGLAIHLGTVGVPPSAYGMGRTVGQVLMPVAVAGLVTWLIARESRTMWAWWRYLIMALAIAVWLSVLLAGASYYRR